MPHKLAVTFQAEMKSFVEFIQGNLTESHLYAGHCPGGGYSQ